MGQSERCGDTSELIYNRAAQPRTGLKLPALCPSLDWSPQDKASSLAKDEPWFFLQHATSVGCHTPIHQHPVPNTLLTLTWLCECPSDTKFHELSLGAFRNEFLKRKWVQELGKKLIIAHSLWDTHKPSLYLAQTGGVEPFIFEESDFFKCCQQVSYTLICYN